MSAHEQAAQRVRDALEGSQVPVSDGLINVVAQAATRGLSDDTALRKARQELRDAKAELKTVGDVAYQKGMNARADQLAKVEASWHALIEVRGFLSHVRAWEGDETARDDLIARINSFLTDIASIPSS